MAKGTRRMNGEGAVFQRGGDNGKWVAEVIIGRDPKTGKLKKKYFYGDKESAVKKRMNAFLKDLEKNKDKQINEYSNILFKNWISEWLDTYKKNSLKPHTLADYERLAILYINPRIGDVPLKEISTKTLQDMYNDLLNNGRIKTKGGLNIRTVKYVHTVCNLSLQKASDLKIIEENVAKFTELPKRNTKKEILPLTLVEELQFIFSCRNERLEVAFWLALSTGLRIGELCALRWSNVDFQTGTFKVCETIQRVKNFHKKDATDTKTVLLIDTPKTSNSVRELPLSDNVLKKLIEHKEKQEKEKENSGTLWVENDFVFSTLLGTVTEPRSMERIFYAIIKKAKLRHINFHLLRHTCTTRLVEENINFKVLQEILGHANKSVTYGYAHASMTLKKEAVQKIDYIFDKSIPENSISEEANLGIKW